MPKTRAVFVVLDGDCTCRFADDRTNRRVVAKEEISLHVGGQNVAGNSEGDWAMMRGEGRLYLSNGRSKEETQAVGKAFAGLKNGFGGWIPFFDALPIGFCKAKGVNHPVVRPLKGCAAGRGVVQ